MTALAKSKYLKNITNETIQIIKQFDTTTFAELLVIKLKQFLPIHTVLFLIYRS